MRIAFDVAPLRDQPSGVGIFAASMATALAGVLLPDELVIIGAREEAQGLPHGGSKVPFHGRGYLDWLNTKAWADSRVAGADLAHFSDGMTPLISRGKTVVSIHDMSVVRAWRTHPARRLLRIPIALAAPHLADLVIVPSRATADEVLRLTGTPARKVEVVPYSAPAGMSPASSEVVEKTLAQYGLVTHGYVLTVGTIEPRKNHLRLIEAFEAAVRVKSIPNDLQLVIVGGIGWHAAPILARIAGSSERARIHHFGYVPAAHLQPLMTGSAAVAYPSLYEGFGLPVVEAMACGASVLTSNTSSMPEVAGDAGVLVNPRDVNDIARGISSAVDAGRNDNLATRAASIAQARQFSWQRTATSAAAMYRNLLP